MCKGGGDGCIERSHGGEGIRSGGSAVVTCPGRATPTSAIPYYAELTRILEGAGTLSSGRGASKCSPSGARMGSEGACEPSVSASFCVSGGRVLVCACVCARARTSSMSHQPYPLPRALAPPGAPKPQTPPAVSFSARPPSASLPAPRPSPARHAPEPQAPHPLTCSMLLLATQSSPRQPGGAQWAAAPPCAQSVVQQPHPATAAREERPESDTQAPPTGPAPPSTPHPRVEASRARIHTHLTHHTHTHTPHTSRGTPLPASPILPVPGAPLVPRRLPPREAPLLISEVIRVRRAPPLILQRPQRGWPKVTSSLMTKLTPWPRPL